MRYTLRKNIVFQGICFFLRKNSFLINFFAEAVMFFLKSGADFIAEFLCFGKSQPGKFSAEGRSHNNNNSVP